MAITVREDESNKDAETRFEARDPLPTEGSVGDFWINQNTGQWFENLSGGRGWTLRMQLAAIPIVTPAAITKTAGDGFSGSTGATVSPAPAVTVTASGGAVIAGVTVIWIVQSGGGSLLAASSTTNASGVAMAPTWTLGTVDGSNTLSATVSGYPSLSVTFSATATTPVNPTQVGAPSFTPGAGTYSGVQSVTIASPTLGASIYYTTDGSNPTTTTGTLYTGPVQVAATTTIRALAVKSGSPDSVVVSATITISTLTQLAAPTLSLVAGTPDTVTISGPSGATLLYSVDGSTPSQTYTAAITPTPNQTIRALARQSGFTDSTETTATYALQAQSGTWRVPGAWHPVGNSAGSLVAPGTLAWAATPSPQGGTVGTAYSFSFSSLLTGTLAGSATVAIVAGSLPPGLTLNTSARTITGTPTVQGTFGSIQLRATAPGRTADTLAFTIVIAAIVVQPPAGTPAWRAPLAVNEWLKFPNSRVSQTYYSPHPDDYTNADVWAQKGDGLFVYSSTAINPVTGHLITHGGGRGTTLDNGIRLFPLLDNTPAWTIGMPPSPYTEQPPALFVDTVPGGAAFRALPAYEQTKTRDGRPRASHTAERWDVVSGSVCRWDSGSADEQAGLPGEDDGGVSNFTKSTRSRRLWKWDIAANLSLPEGSRSWVTDTEMFDCTPFGWGWEAPIRTNHYGDGKAYIVGANALLSYTPGASSFTVVYTYKQPQILFWADMRWCSHCIDHTRNRTLVIRGDYTNAFGRLAYLPLTPDPSKEIVPVLVDDPAQPGAVAAAQFSPAGLTYPNMAAMSCYVEDLDAFMVTRQSVVSSSPIGAPTDTLDSVWLFKIDPADSSRLIVSLLWGSPYSTTPWVLARSRGSAGDVCPWSGSVPWDEYQNRWHHRKMHYVKALKGVVFCGNWSPYDSVYFLSTGALSGTTGGNQQVSFLSHSLAQAAELGMSAQEILSATKHCRFLEVGDRLMLNTGDFPGFPRSNANRSDMPPGFVNYSQGNSSQGVYSAPISAAVASGTATFTMECNPYHNYPWTGSAGFHVPEPQKGPYAPDGYGLIVDKNGNVWVGPSGGQEQYSPIDINAEGAGEWRWPFSFFKYNRPGTHSSGIAFGNGWTLPQQERLLPAGYAGQFMPGTNLARTSGGIIDKQYTGTRITWSSYGRPGYVAYDPVRHEINQLTLGIGATWGDLDIYGFSCDPDGGGVHRITKRTIAGATVHAALPWITGATGVGIQNPTSGSMVVVGRFLYAICCARYAGTPTSNNGLGGWNRAILLKINLDTLALTWVPWSASYNWLIRTWDGPDADLYGRYERVTDVPGQERVMVRVGTKLVLGPDLRAKPGTDPMIMVYDTEADAWTPGPQATASLLGGDAHDYPCAWGDSIAAVESQGEVWLLAGAEGTYIGDGARNVGVDATAYPWTTLHQAMLARGLFNPPANANRRIIRIKVN